MVKSCTAGVLLAFVAAALVSGCENEEDGASSVVTSSEAASDNDSAGEAQQPDPEPASIDKPQSVKKPPPEWTLEAAGAMAFQKKGRSVAFTYRDQVLHMRLLYNPSGGGFGQGLTFHLPHVATGQTGPVKASFANFTFEDEGVRCSTRGKNTHFEIDLTEFNRDVREGSFEGRLLCHLLDAEAREEAQRDNEEPKYVDVSGRFRHD
jgi:hypothetical protein